MPFSGCYTVGRKRSFLNAAGTVETWEYQGGAFTAVGSWVQGGAQKVAELESNLLGYYSNRYIDKAGKATSFMLLCYTEISYTIGDSIAVENAASGAAYNMYNFFHDVTFISSANDLNNIPSACTIIKVNGKMAEGLLITINGKGANLISKSVYSEDKVLSLEKNLSDLRKDVSTNASVAVNAEKTALKVEKEVSILENEIFTIYKTFVLDYGNNGIFRSSKEITQSVSNGIYSIVSPNNGTYIYCNNSTMSSGRRIAYYIDIEFEKVPEKYKSCVFGSINARNRKTIPASDYGYDSYSGKRVQAVFKTTANASDTAFLLITHPSDMLIDETIFKIHFLCILDCGDTPDHPLYDLTENEILDKLENRSSIFGEKVYVRTNDSIAPVEKNAMHSLFGKEFFSVGDSLSSTGLWQQSLAQEAGAVFDQEFNEKQLISAGGTSSSGISYNSGQMRLKRLLEQKNPEVIIFENINDLLRTDDYSDFGMADSIPYMVGKISVYEVVYANLSAANEAWRTSKQNIINSIIGEKSIGHAIRIPYTNSNGKKLIVSGVVIKEGDFIINVNDYRTTIHALTTDSIADVIRKIEEVSYPNTFKESDYSTFISFFKEDGDPATVAYSGQASLGLSFNQESVEGLSYINRYFLSKNLSEFTDTSKWSETVSKWSLYKGMFEYTRKYFPYCRLIWFIPTRLPIAWNPTHASYEAGLWYKDESINMSAWLQSDHYKWYEILKRFQKEVCEIYGVQVVDIQNTCGISAANVIAYYPEFNVHPLPITYQLWGWGLARLLV